MKYPLLFVIRFYWLVIPASKRNICLYHKSCSKHVYDVTNEKGLFVGLKELATRIKTCRPNHEVIYLDQENVLLIKLSNGTTLQQNEISENIVSAYINKMDTIEY
ncbi:MAG: membrane protein insertion efficiency factor YidD [Bacteroidota bacterium]